mmetsp:Transcript_17370/g.44326  ORF Transcript_17370/g.44326 Transcript_17370/m.44326 type:complete len:125 (+) Transcript_17370:1205-1579(+)
MGSLGSSSGRFDSKGTLTGRALILTLARLPVLCLSLSPNSRAESKTSNRNMEGSWKVFNISTGKACTLQRFIALPTPDNVIQSLNDLRKEDGPKSSRAGGRRERTSWTKASERKTSHNRSSTWA